MLGRQSTGLLGRRSTGLLGRWSVSSGEGCEGHPLRISRELVFSAEAPVPEEDLGQVVGTRCSTPGLAVRLHLTFPAREVAQRFWLKIFIL